MKERLLSSYWRSATHFIIESPSSSQGSYIKHLIRLFLLKAIPAALLAVSAFLCTSCLDSCEEARAQARIGNHTDSLYADKNLGNSLDAPLGLGDERFFTYNGSEIALFDATSGTEVWTHNFGEPIYPLLIRNTSTKDNSILTWINEHGIPNIAILNPQDSLIYRASDAIISAEYDGILVVEVMTKQGPESINAYSTEIVDSESGRIIKRYELVSPQTQSAAGLTSYRFSESNSPVDTLNEFIVLSGPASKSNLDNYGNTDRETIVKYNMETRKEVFNKILDKEYGSPLELVFESREFTIFHYSIEQTNERLICIDSAGKTLWTHPIDGQLVRPSLYPYSSGLNKYVTAVNEKQNIFAFYSVHEFSAPTVTIIELLTGSIKNTINVDTEDRFATSMEFSDKELTINLQHGLSAVKIDISNGSLAETAPTEETKNKKRLEWTPFIWKNESSGLHIEIAKGKLNLKAPKNSSSIEVPFPTDSKPEVIGIYENPPRYLLMSFVNAELNQNIVPVESRVLVDFKTQKALIGDIFDSNSKLFYGIDKYIVTNTTIYRVGNDGKINNIANLSGK